jgi:hypothetical protein
VTCRAVAPNVGWWGPIRENVIDALLDANSFTTKRRAAAVVVQPSDGSSCVALDGLPVPGFSDLEWLTDPRERFPMYEAPSIVRLEVVKAWCNNFGVQYVQHALLTPEPVVMIDALDFERIVDDSIGVMVDIDERDSHQRRSAVVAGVRMVAEFWERNPFAAPAAPLVPPVVDTSDDTFPF